MKSLSSTNIIIGAKLFTFNKSTLENSISLILSKLQISGIKNSGFASCPTKKKRFTVLRAPHVDKKSREQFEKKEYSKYISIYFKNTAIDKQKAKQLINYIKYVHESTKFTYFSISNTQKV